MHVRADAGGLEMIEGAALDGAAGLTEAVIATSIRSAESEPAKPSRKSSTSQFNRKML